MPSESIGPHMAAMLSQHASTFKLSMCNMLTAPWILRAVSAFMLNQKAPTGAPERLRGKRSIGGPQHRVVTGSAEGLNRTNDGIRWLGQATASVLGSQGIH